MPKIRRSRKKPPDGWELIEPTLEELEQKMREGKNFDTKIRLANDSVVVFFFFFEFVYASFLFSMRFLFVK